MAAVVANANTVKPGDFCCVPISGEGGKLIGLGEWLNGDKFTQYQHAEVYVGTTSDLMQTQRGSIVALQAMLAGARYGWTMGAYPGGARLVPLPCLPEELPGALWSSGAIPLTPVQRTQVVTAAVGLMHTPYSALDYFAIAAHRLHIPVPGLRAYISSTGHLICSQLVDECYAQAGIHLFDDGRWPGYVTPADLAALIHSKERT